MDSGRCSTLLVRVPDGSDSAPIDGVVVYRSRGAVLVIGDAVDALAPARALAATLPVVVFAPGIEDTQGLPPRLSAIGGRIVAVKGHLGCFRAFAAVGGGDRRDMGPFSPNADGTFDLVLDLGRVPRIERAVGPPGYFAPREPDAVDTAIAAIAGMVGTFRKPKYFDYAPGLCTHGAKGVAGCTRCLTACDADAIRSAGDTIAVDPHLCQGCAACTLACPTGALSFVVPSRSDLMQQIDVALATAAANGVAAPALIIHAAAVPMLPEATPPSAQAIEVDALPAFGDELWLTALARGASAVALVDDGTRPPRARAQLERRIAEAQAVLAATGAAPSAIALVQRDALPALAPFAAPATVPTRMPATTTNPTKRAVVLAAIDALLAAHRPTGDAPLPAGSTFGDVVVDVAACTLCLACVQLCPTAALRAGTGVRPALDFVEAECVQCSLCATGCPEHAIRLAPRLLHDRIARNAARTLAEDELFPCPNCGTPFIGRKLLERSIAHLRDHPVLRDGGLERLRLCPECRTRAALDVG